MSDLSIVSVADGIGVLLSIGGIVWAAGRSSARADANKKFIQKEGDERREHDQRLEALILKNENESKERAAINSANMKELTASRERNNILQSTHLNTLTASAQSLSQQVGVLQGTLETFIGEVRSQLAITRTKV